jgi:hypothetical protein
LHSQQVYSLSIHADYRCRHSGQCCSLDWDVPIELPVYRSLQGALTAGTLRVAAAAHSDAPFVVEPDLPGDAAAIFRRTEEGRCVFFEPESRLCVVHRDLGATALPVTCRLFPRVAVQDRRGTFVGLSHFCPTAAGMLFRTDVPLRIVSAPPAFPPGDYDGLTVGEEELPPLLRPDVAMDLEGYTAWERHMVDRCVDGGRLPEAVLATLARDAEQLARWRPGGTSLSRAVAELPSDAVEVQDADSLAASLRLYDECLRAVPPELRDDRDLNRLEAAFDRWVRPRWRVARAPLNHYIASKAVASWTGYQGRGIRTIVRGIEAAVALVRVEAARGCRDAGRELDDELLLEAIRSADFILNHQAIGEDLAENWGRAIGEY